jgi:hypothetical protein
MPRPIGPGYLYSFENPLRAFVTVNDPSSRAEIFTQ